MFSCVCISIKLLFSANAGGTVCRVVCGTPACAVDTGRTSEGRGRLRTDDFKPVNDVA